MDIDIKFTGMKRLEAGLNREIRSIGKRTQAGVVAAAMHVRRESQKITPYKYGNLVNSAYVLWKDGKKDKPKDWNNTRKDAGKLEDGHKEDLEDSRKIIKKESKYGPVAVIGYTAYYATYVHEIPFMNYTKKGTGPYFLEKTLREKRKEIMEIIKRRVAKKR